MKINPKFSAAVVFDEKGRVLLCRRATYKKIAPNMWHLPGGTIESDETAVDTIKRELLEELGLNAVAVLPTDAMLNYQIGSDSFQTLVFYVEVSNKPTIMNEENSALEFVNPREIANYIESSLVEDNTHAIKFAARVRQTRKKK